MSGNENAAGVYDGNDNNESGHAETLLEVLDTNLLPRKLPYLYGDNAWLVGLTSDEPFILDNPSDAATRERIAVSFRIIPVFYQTPEQKAYTDAIAQQAATNSISGLRKQAESHKFINEKRSAFVSTALDVAIYVYLVDEEDLAEGQTEGDNDKEIFYGTMLRIPVNTEGWADRAPSRDEGKGEIDEVLNLLETMFTLRQNSFTQSLINGVQAHADVTSRIAEISAANFLDEDISTASGGVPLDADAIFAAQQKEAVEKIRIVYSGATKPPSKLKDVKIRAEGIADLIYKYNYINEAMVGTDSDEVISETLLLLGRVTDFIEPQSGSIISG